MHSNFALNAITIILQSFNNHFYLQVNGTAMGPHMSCSYSDIAMYKFDLKTLNYKEDLLCWKRFRDNAFMLWNQSFFDFMKSIDTSGKIKFAMSVATESVLEFPDLNFDINKQNKMMLMPNLRIALRICFLLHVILKGT